MKKMFKKIGLPAIALLGMARIRQRLA